MLCGQFGHVITEWPVGPIEKQNSAIIRLYLINGDSLYGKSRSQSGSSRSSQPTLLSTLLGSTVNSNEISQVVDKASPYSVLGKEKSVPHDFA